MSARSKLGFSKVRYDLMVDNDGRWVLHDSLADKAEAIARAKVLITSPRVTGVRVFEEPGDMTMASQEKSVFAAGTGDAAMAERARDADDTLPYCEHWTDLTLKDSRRFIARVLRDQLDKWVITPLELLHAPVYQDRLDNAGPFLQRLVQKAAVLQARQKNQNMHERAKELNNLISEGRRRLYQDAKEEKLPVLSDGQTIPMICADLERHGRSNLREYYVYAALANHVRGLNSWMDKLDRVFALVDSSFQPEHMALIDGYVAEALEAASAVKDVLGEQPNMLMALATLADLAYGRLAHLEADAPTSLQVLNMMLGADKLPQTRQALLMRLVQQVGSARALISAENLPKELEMLNILVQSLTDDDGELLGGELLREAFYARWDRMMVEENVAQLTRGTKNPMGKLTKMLNLIEMSMGMRTKKRLGNYFRIFLNDRESRDFLLKQKNAFENQGKILADMQRRVIAAGVPDPECQQISEILDDMVLTMMHEEKIVENIERRERDVVKRCNSLLHLCKAGLVTQGEASAHVRSRVMRCLVDPSFMPNYFKGADDKHSRAQRANELHDALISAGLTEREAGLFG